MKDISDIYFEKYYVEKQFAAMEFLLPDGTSYAAYLLVGLRYILRGLQLDCHDSLAPENAIKAGNRAFVAALHELYPKGDKAGALVPAAHVGDEFQLLRGMLVGMTVGRLDR